MRSIFLTVILFFFIFPGPGLYAQAIKKIDGSKVSFSALEQKIDFLMKAANVHGLAIAVFNNNDVGYKKIFGYKRIDTKEPLKTNTNFYGASLSKSVFAVLVMKLVQQGKIDLDNRCRNTLKGPFLNISLLRSGMIITST